MSNAYGKEERIINWTKSKDCDANALMCQLQCDVFNLRIILIFLNKKNSSCAHSH